MLCDHYHICRVTGTDTVSSVRLWWILPGWSETCQHSMSLGHPPGGPSFRWKRSAGSYKWTSNAPVRKCSFRMQDNYANVKENPHVSVWLHILHTWTHSPKERNSRCCSMNLWIRHYTCTLRCPVSVETKYLWVCVNLAELNPWPDIYSPFQLP